MVYTSCTLLLLVAASIVYKTCNSLNVDLIVSNLDNRHWYTNECYRYVTQPVMDIWEYLTVA